MRAESRLLGRKILPQRHQLPGPQALQVTKTRVLLDFTVARRLLILRM
jgi:hypothetical protein